MGGFMKNKLKDSMKIIPLTLTAFMMTSAFAQPKLMRKVTNFHTRGGVLVETSLKKGKIKYDGVSLNMISDITSVKLQAVNGLLANATWTIGGMKTKYLPQIGAGVMYCVSKNDEDQFALNTVVSYTLGQFISDRNKPIINVNISVHFPVYKYEKTDYDGSFNITFSVGPVMVGGTYNLIKTETEFPKFSVGTGADIIYILNTTSKR